jgi:hypothetical protein
VEKVNALKIDFIPYYDSQFALTTQNIVVAFNINREVPEGSGSKEKK